MQEPDYKNLTPLELKEKLEGPEHGNRPELLDVREPWEFELARIEGSRLVPLAQVNQRVAELDPLRETVVICHHGLRSAYATRFLQASGFANVSNLEGGLEAYSRVDEDVPRY